MSSWITITLQATEDKPFEYSLKEELKKKDSVTKIARHDNNPVAMLAAKWRYAEEILDEIDHWDKAVVCRSNDTGDVGTARLYKKSEDSWHTNDDYKMIDEFEENELAHGRFVGAKACAYMLLHHDVHALPTLNRPRRYTYEIPSHTEEQAEAFDELRKAVRFIEDCSYNKDMAEECLEKTLDKLRNAWN